MQNQEDVGGRPGRTDSHSGSRSAASPGRKRPSSLIILLAATILLGIATGWFVSPRGGPSGPTVEMVSPAERPQALMTLTGDMQMKARVDTAMCRHPLGVITVVMPGKPMGGSVRFSTSKYTSPPFHVTDKPQRIAIPSPVPETGGMDVLTAEGETSGLLVSLYPTARMDLVGSGSKTRPTATVNVFWRPRPPCK